MYKSVLLRKTIILLLVALFASALFTTFAFTIAGKSATYLSQTDRSKEQINSLASFFSTYPELIDDQKITDALFSDTSITGNSIFLFSKDGELVYCPSKPSATDSKYFDIYISFVQEKMLDKVSLEKNYESITIGKNLIDKTFIIQQPVYIDVEIL